MADSARPLNRRTFLVTSGLATATVLSGTAHAACREQASFRQSLRFVSGAL
ncbi:twin-arginine translocation signal domain-containing protein [Actinomadura bangladeshensis]|uniref:Twin-arginine translocation signal domain-containing protein n=1 Tax=Actinomadura bangladeshensis TaxID=453573 RepID=A0A4R4P813_9ACTN|nr:twin-arginine translocation signal domain-containing protein [Actinomadura bangladeshensis]TDC18315.1 twin-arginine translocation signal domain-containing protein [Actinomadura bangladeshensis]